ncbi:MAG: hypothetical protein HQ481_21125 [Alphaproteobacteria bacterium]|nr:hypothetical protein [Alphaproteobacteria bacterium]
MGAALMPALLSVLLTAVVASVLLPWAFRLSNGIGPGVTEPRGFRVGLALTALLILATPAVGHTLLGRADPGGFGTLSLGARLGLLALSTVLLLALLWVGALKSRWLARWPCAPLLDLLAGAALALAAITLSAQLFYGYYRLVIPGLPAQGVIAWPGGQGIVELFAVWRDGPLGERVRGAVFWAVTLAGPIARWLARSQPTPPSRALAAALGAALAVTLHGAGAVLMG